jgi:hypothetical protein
MSGDARRVASIRARIVWAAYAMVLLGWIACDFGRQTGETGAAGSIAALLPASIEDAMLQSSTPRRSLD